MTYRLSHPTYKFAMDAAMPARTSAWLLKQAHSYLAYLRDANCEVFLPNQFTALTTMIQAFVNGAIGVQLPSKERWIQAYSDNTGMSAICDLVTNPSKINNAALSTVNYNYWAPLRNSQIVLEDGLLIYCEPIRGGSCYTHLQLFQTAFYNIIFITFHSNAIGGRLNAYHTLHRICLHYYWPGMFSYIKQMCTACPGCTLANPTKSKSTELVYNFPIEAPFLVLFVGAYLAGKHFSFDGFETYLVACCGMTSFAFMKPLVHANAKKLCISHYEDPAALWVLSHNCS
jgi:hypothetical protein